MCFVGAVAAESYQPEGVGCHVCVAHPGVADSLRERVHRHLLTEVQLVRYLSLVLGGPDSPLRVGVAVRVGVDLVGGVDNHYVPYFA